MKKIISLMLFFFLYLTIQTNTSAEAVYPFSNINDESRFQDLSREVRCVVCQYQNIADSNAPLAKDLRRKIYMLIQDKKTDEEIKTYLQKRYGEFILLEPNINKFTMLLWAFPFIGLLLSLSLPFVFKSRLKLRR